MGRSLAAQPCSQDSREVLPVSCLKCLQLQPGTREQGVFLLGWMILPGAAADLGPPASGWGLGLGGPWCLDGGPELRCVGKRGEGQSRGTVKEGRGSFRGSLRGVGGERRKEGTTPSGKLSGVRGACTLENPTLRCRRGGSIPTGLQGVSLGARQRPPALPLLRPWDVQTPAQGLRTQPPALSWACQASR